MTSEALLNQLWTEARSLEPNQWLSLLVIAAAAIALGALVRVVLDWALHIDHVPGLAKGTSVRRNLGRAVVFTVTMVVFEALLVHVFLPPNLARFIATAGHGLLIMAAVLFAYAVWDVVCELVAARASGDRRAEKLLVPILGKAVKVAIVVVGLLAAISLFLGTRQTVGLLAGLGIGGIVLALAAKDSVENVFGSLTILFDMPFAIDDWVKIGTVEGVVEEINLRSTRIRTFEDSVVTLPNSNLIKASVENFGARRFRRQRFHFRLGYRSSPESVEAFCLAVHDYLGSAADVLSGRSHVELNDVTDTSLGVLVVAFFEVDSYATEVRMRHELLLFALRAARDSGVQLVGQ
jgi:MscS family membrane protein